MAIAAMAMTMDLARRSAAAPTDIGLAFTIVPCMTVIVFPVLVGIALFFVLTDAGLVAILLYDVITRGRPHSATVWGGLFLIGSQYIRVTAGATAAWIACARMLAR